MCFTESEIGDIGDWRQLPFFQKGQHNCIAKCLGDWKNVRPERHQVFRALQLTHPKNVKVVILGQDPYPVTSTPDGLAFSSPDSRRPDSLQRVLCCIAEECDLNFKGKTNCLAEWAAQGVLLLNTILTVDGKIGKLSHEKCGWKDLAQQCIEKVSSGDNKVAFLLWGDHAHKYEKWIQEKEQHIIFKPAHPMARPNAKNQFCQENQFHKLDEWLVGNKKCKMNWSLKDTP